jgi:hypothetical protein
VSAVRSNIRLRLTQRLCETVVNAKSQTTRSERTAFVLANAACALFRSFRFVLMDCSKNRKSTIDLFYLLRDLNVLLRSAQQLFFVLFWVLSE